MKRSYKIGIMTALLGFITSMQSCEKDYFVPIPVTIPDSVSFAGNIQPIFDANCVNSGCHSGAISPNLTKEYAYEDLFLSNMVDTLNPESSVLYVRMTQSGKPMPPSGLLKGGETDLVLKWIEQGAKNN